MPEISGRPQQRGYILPNRPRLSGVVSPNRRFPVMFNSVTSAANSRPSNDPSKRTRAGTVTGALNDNRHDRIVPRTAYSTEPPAEVTLPEIDSQTQPSKLARRMTIGEPLRDESPRRKKVSVMKLIANHGSAGTKGSSLSSPVAGSKTEQVYGTTYDHGKTTRLPGSKEKAEDVLYGATHPSLRNEPQEMQYTEIPGVGTEPNAEVDGNDNSRSCWSSLVDSITCLGGISKNHQHKKGSAK